MRGEFKILALQAELLAAQLESFTREFDTARVDFRREFSRELEFLNIGVSAPDPVLPPPIEASREVLKPVYRKLAKMLHPDIRPDDPQAEEDFKRLAAAHARGDAVEVLAMASRYEIDPAELATGIVQELNRVIVERRGQLTKMHDRVEWYWHTSDRGDESRRVVRKTMGIDMDAFNAWLAGR